MPARFLLLSVTARLASAADADTTGFSLEPVAVGIKLLE